MNTAPTRVSINKYTKRQAGCFIREIGRPAVEPMNILRVGVEKLDLAHRKTGRKGGHDQRLKVRRARQKFEALAKWHDDTGDVFKLRFPRKCHCNDEYHGLSLFLSVSFIWSFFFLAIGSLSARRYQPFLSFSRPLNLLLDGKGKTRCG